MRGTLHAGVALALVACGGSSGNGDGSDHPLTGSWMGVEDRLTGGYTGTLALEIDGDGDVTEVRVNGEDLNLTATEVDEVEGIRVYRTSDGAEFFLRRVGSSMAYVDRQDDVAVLSRGIDEVPDAGVTDTVGTFEGVSFVTDSFYNLIGSTDGIGRIFDDNGSLLFDFEAPATGCRSVGELNLDSAQARRYTGFFVNVSGGNCPSEGDIRHYLAPSGDEVLTVACSSFSSFNVPGTCEFLLGTRQ